ncbi:indole-3-glycerol-phosphate synthase [Paucilactobacillus hokkaidonensis JCM 18461]|uniref:Indole-3-glycerol phosphate synthase n=2 Tax=Paucilactobacillus hokkaidonensis TaxID=1193095 RepID=A0A0A1H063_9LACO|nr:indole-3-glycerol phosphate synthase TrpC [Paucilactobacillus hokkaidonensis]KRO08750.1 indole-3-glycerol-phosphate synthase [Paucilactobacillus hokkaidonensis]BAP86639.1 indole-3-glycerol-phosphate synthase [Paucilactobacillus hokkaidonensis JCM 18461]
MILDQLVAATTKRVAKSKERVPFTQLKAQTDQLVINSDRPFETALTGNAMHIISEVKKASPSKGLIADHFPYLQIAKEYEQAGANAISVLTEPDYFQGSIEYLKAIANEVKIPVLRKDFIIDEYMIYEAKLAGASAILLIVKILTPQQLETYLRLADQLGLSALVEAHDEIEIKNALQAGAKIIGVNNRNLNDFSVDFNNSARLRQLVPTDRIFVAESGVQSKQDTQTLQQNGITVALIGETLMKATDKTQLIQQLKEPIAVDQS